MCRKYNLFAPKKGQVRRLYGCAQIALLCIVSPSLTLSQTVSEAVMWNPVKSIDVVTINKDVVAGQPTVDIGIYYPSNLDQPVRDAVPLSSIVAEFLSAKKIFGVAGVQLNLLWAKTGPIDPRYFSIQADNPSSELPDDGYANIYRRMERTPTQISGIAKNAFNAIIERSPDNARTVYLVVLQGVYMAYYDTPDDGRNWTQRLVRTGGLSFPGYTYGESIPRRLRGVITLSGTRPDNWRRTAHELGHKLMNVSHEYMDQSPQHEVVGDGGLMFYGSGTDIPSGVTGRWHRERLHLSPYIYRKSESGERIWNQDYESQGFYYDELYGDKVVVFGG